MQDTPPGSMLAVRAPVDVVAAASTAGRVDRGDHPANLTVVSGAAEAIAAFAAALTDGIAHRRLHTSHAYHHR